MWLALAKKSVRVIAGEFADQLFTVLQSLREVVAVRAAALEPCVCPKNKTHLLASSAMVMVGPVGILEVTSDWRKLEDNKGNTEWRTLSETRGCGVQLQEPLENTWSSIRYALEKEAFRREKGQD